MSYVHNKLAKYVMDNNLEAVTRLLESKTNVDVRTNNDYILILAVDRDNWDIVFKLLEYGGDIEGENGNIFEVMLAMIVR